MIKKEPNNKYRTIKIKFIDSFRFMSQSLSTLVDYLAVVKRYKNIFPNKCTCVENLVYMKFEDDHMFFKCFDCNTWFKCQFEFNFIKSLSNTYNFAKKNINKFILLLRKYVYPYEYMTDWDRFNETKLLPVDRFYRKLTQQGIKEIDYRHANKVFETSKLKNMRDFRDLYDTLQLFDVFEKFRSTCDNIFKLDPANYLSAAGLFWNACLEKTAIKLELLTDLDMFLLIESGLRRGICHPVKRYAKANNKYMKIYDKKKKSSYILYLDANNLYGYVMVRKLPKGGIKWVKNISEFTPDFIKNYDENSVKGYFIEADIIYPKELQSHHSDLPFFPERLTINKTKKLACTLYDKCNYVTNISMLKSAIKHGLILEKVHKVIEFDQEVWMKVYADMNTTHRTNAKNEFVKKFFKLCNNAVFGKTMENKIKNRDIKLVTTQKKRMKLVREPNFYRIKHFTNDLSAFEKRKTNILMDKPIYFGFTILELSKVALIYEFWYEYLKPKYGKNRILPYGYR